MNTGIHHSVFTKDEFHYCVQIDHVREVIRIPELILAPSQTVGFMGFLDFRKKLCPVLDIQALLRNEAPIASEGPYNLIVLEYQSILFAILIDRFVESLQLGEDALSADSAPPSDSRQKIVSQVVRYQGKALNLIDLAVLKTFVELNLDKQMQPQSAIEQDVEQQIEADAEIEMICFGIDHFRFGIPISSLIEVIEGYSVEPLFRTSSFLRGLINLRGQIIACVDISEAIGLPRRKMEEKNQYILLQDNDRDLALCIDSISKKQKFARAQIQNVEHIFSGELADYLLGIIETGAERIFVISGPKIFASKYLVPYQE